MEARTSDMKIKLKKIRSVLAIPNIYRLFIRIVAKRSKQLAFIEEYARPKAGDKILDIGCGTADILEYLPDVDYLGLDVEQRYIDAAVKRYGNRGKFICRKISSDAIREPSSFDIVLAKGVLHHLNDEEAVQLFELARNTMKPEGRLITMDGCYDKGRSKLEHFILSMDRGKHVRTREEYYTIASKVFPNVKASIRHDLLRIPYTHIIMECSL
jgi:SAM-dependent methyltransferase